MIEEFFGLLTTVVGHLAFWGFALCLALFPFLAIAEAFRPKK